jgi:uncharacterized protein YbaR (Trm112 family)
MEFFCNKVDPEGVKCNNRVTLPKDYCKLHKIKPIIMPKVKVLPAKPNNKILLPKKHNINKNDIDNKDHILQDCPICLCEIEANEEDPGLICNHKFHVECLNHVEKSECPVCRGPLEFVKSSKVNIDKIKNKEEEELLKKKQKQMKEDEELSRRLQNERNERPNRRHRNHNDNMFQIDHNTFFNMIMQMQEMEELHQINQAIENSLIF